MNGVGQCVPNGGHPEGQCSTCVSGTIQAGCDDGLGCTTDTCDPVENNCVHTPDDSACDDDEFCTIDSCDVENGCQHDNKTNGTSCSDGNPITYESVCWNGACSGRWYKRDKCIYQDRVWYPCIDDRKTGFKWMFSACKEPGLSLSDAAAGCAALGTYWHLPSISDYHYLVTSKGRQDCSSPSKTVYLDPAFQDVKSGAYYWTSSFDQISKKYFACRYNSSASDPDDCQTFPSTESLRVACVNTGK